jgi:moderate conductance mechanosensitive channel
MMTAFHKFMGIESTSARILLLLLLALGSHGLVLIVKALMGYLVAYASSKSQSKLKSVASLAKSFLVFIIYFRMFGLILREMGISLTTYLASASVIGLAIGFGSQGLVQDVVTGLTLVLSNLIDVGDMVEIGGQTGMVRSIGMRFTILENALGAEVFIPNRSIINVINYPRGYV